MLGCGFLVPDRRYAVLGYTEKEPFLELARAEVEEDLAEVIALGCAGLSGMDKYIQAEVEAPVLDGVAPAMIIATGLVRWRVSTSMRLGYNPEY